MNCLYDYQFNTSNGLFTSSEGVGVIHGGTSGGAARGGDWADFGSNGYGAVFTLNLNLDPTTTYGSVGFRCVFRPNF